MFHQLFEGLSLGIRIASLPARHGSKFKRLPFFEQTLSILFAVTTPIGMVIGLLSFLKGADSGASSMHFSTDDSLNMYQLA
jgi:zinc transporter 1/2/3